MGLETQEQEDAAVAVQFALQDALEVKCVFDLAVYARGAPARADAQKLALHLMKQVPITTANELELFWKELRELADSPRLAPLASFHSVLLMCGSRARSFLMEALSDCCTDCNDMYLTTHSQHCWTTAVAQQVYDLLRGYGGKRSGEHRFDKSVADHDLFTLYAASDRNNTADVVRWFDMQGPQQPQQSSTAPVAPVAPVVHAPAVAIAAPRPHDDAEALNLMRQIVSKVAQHAPLPPPPAAALQPAPPAPLRRTLIPDNDANAEVVSRPGSIVCLSCYSISPNHLCVPCNHASVCLACARRMRDIGERDRGDGVIVCLKCRAPVTQLTPFYPEINASF
ncbi:Hypothetical protein UVM_LOCUS300 [uncultured virus]|nr:Hypothetical protein UVM_LOCUS300 [uncultured virus]